MRSAPSICGRSSERLRRGGAHSRVAVAWDADDWTFDALTAHYKTLVRYIRFRDMGMVLGHGCGTPGMTERSPYPEQAYRLGRGL